MSRLALQHLQKTLSPLKGWRLDGVVEDVERFEEYEERFPALLFSKGPLKVVVVIQCDEEGNGPGWLEIAAVRGPRSLATAFAKVAGIGDLVYVPEKGKTVK